MSLVDKLRTGIRLFSDKMCAPDSPYTQQVTEGQRAKVLVVGCCDSLVDPNTLMGAHMGELFVHRNIAALIPPYESDDMNHYHGTSAVLEFAVRGLKVEHIIVLGHGNCGGIQALLRQELPYGDTENSFLWRWISMAEKARDTQSPCCARTLEQAAVKLSLQHLMTFPWIAEAVAQKKLALHGWHFDRGIFCEYDATHDTFRIQPRYDE